MELTGVKAPAAHELLGEVGAYPFERVEPLASDTENEDEITRSISPDVSLGEQVLPSICVKYISPLGNIHLVGETH